MAQQWLQVLEVVRSQTRLPPRPQLRGDGRHRFALVKLQHPQQALQSGAELQYQHQALTKQELSDLDHTETHLQFRRQDAHLRHQRLPLCRQQAGPGGGVGQLSAYTEEDAISRGVGAMGSAQHSQGNILHNSTGKG